MKQVELEDILTTILNQSTKSFDVGIETIVTVELVVAAVAQVTGLELRGTLGFKMFTTRLIG